MGMAGPDTMRRRDLLKTAALAGSVGVAGCLRLTQEAGPDSATPTTGGGTATRSATTTDSSTIPQLQSVRELFDVEWSSDKQIGSIQFHDNSLYGESGGTVRKFSRETGELQWETTPEHGREDNLIQSVRPTGSIVCVLERSDPDTDEPVRLFGVDPQDGTEVWYFEGEFAQWFTSSNRFATSDRYAAFVQQRKDNSTTNIWTADIRTGERLSKTTIDEDDEDTDIRFVRTVLIRGERLLLFGNKVEVRDVTTGAVRKTRDLDLSHASVDGDWIYAGGSSVAKLSLDGLEPSWRTEVSSRTTASPEVSNEQNKLVVGMKTGVRCFDASTGDPEWEYRTAGEISDYDGGVELIDGVVWAFDDAGHLSVIDLGSGDQVYDEQQKSNGDHPSDMIASESRLYLSLVSSGEQPRTELPRGTSAMSISID